MRAPRSTSPRVALLLLTLLLGCDRLAELAPKKAATRESDTSESEEEAPKKKKKKKEPQAAPPDAPPPELTFTAMPSPPPTSSAKLEFERVAPLLPDAPTIAPADDFTKLAASKILPKLREQKLPALRATEIVVYPARVKVTLHDQPSLAEVRIVWLQGESVSDKGNALPFIKEPATKLAEREFDVTSVDWAGLPQLVADASRRVNGRVTSHVVIERPLPFDRDVQTRVFVNDVDGVSKFVDYDAKGRFKRNN